MVRDSPRPFFEEADLFLHLFKQIDKTTTYRIIKQTRNDDIAPSWFGEEVIIFSEINYAIVQNANPSKAEVLKHFSRNTFLNLAAWYILPLFAANGYECPYMPERWIKKFLNEKTSLATEECRKYLAEIHGFIENSEPKTWVNPYKSIASQLGPDACVSILFLVGMFLVAYEKQKKPRVLPALEETSKQAGLNLDPEIIGFLDSIKEIDKLPPA